MNKLQSTPTGRVEGNSPKSILFLDDEADLCSIFKAMLEAENYEVTCVQSGLEGLNKIMINDYDVIVCDVMMPNLTGSMFYVAVEGVKPHLCKRFIFITGLRGDKKIEEFVGRIRAVILWKPFYGQELIEAIEQVLIKTNASC